MYARTRPASAVALDRRRRGRAGRCGAPRARRAARPRRGRSSWRACASATASGCRWCSTSCATSTASAHRHVQARGGRVAARPRRDAARAQRAASCAGAAIGDTVTRAPARRRGPRRCASPAPCTPRAWPRRGWSTWCPASCRGTRRCAATPAARRVGADPHRRRRARARRGHIREVADSREGDARARAARRHAGRRSRRRASTRTPTRWRVPLPPRAFGAPRASCSARCSSRA